MVMIVKSSDRKTLESYTKEELVFTIALWLEIESKEQGDLESLISALRSGTWLRYFNGEL
jgi:hypothetical protein